MDSDINTPPKMNAIHFMCLQKMTTLTLWTTCGRSSGVNAYNEWEGVVCLGEEGYSKVTKYMNAMWHKYSCCTNHCILCKNQTAHHV